VQHDLHEIAKETRRLIVIRCNAPELLVLEDGRGFTLPSVEIPKGSRVAREVNDQFKRIWNLDVFSLYPLPPIAPASGSTASPCYVVETVRPDAPVPNRAQWRPISMLSDQNFVNADDAAAIHGWLEDPDNTRANGDQSVLGSAGSFSRTRAWVQQILEPSGVGLGREFLQINATRSFSLVRFETDEGAVWFKAVGKPNVREFPITVALSNLFPRYTAPLLATEPRWNAWLASDVPGVPLSHSHDVEVWSRAARDLAALQVASVGTAQTILKWNPRDVKTFALLGLVEPFFVRLRAFMDRQTSSHPAPLSSREMDELESYTRNALCNLQGQRPPDTLGHLDLNPDNLIALPQRTVFLDWAEASIGHPFLSFAYLLEHFRTQFHDHAAGPEQLVRNYAGVWHSQGQFEDMEQSICLALFVAIFAHAVSTDAWCDTSRPQEPRLEGYYRSLARRMKLYAGRIREGASTVSELWS
jgi:hypothetical protein